MNETTLAVPVPPSASTLLKLAATAATAAISAATLLVVSGCAAPKPAWPRAVTVFQVSEECGAGLVFADNEAAATAVFGSAVAVNRLELALPTYLLIRSNPSAAQRLLGGHSADGTMASACQALLNSGGK